MVGRQSGFGVDNEAAGFWVLPRSGCRYNTVNWIRQGEKENILEVGPRSRKVSFMSSRFRSTRAFLEPDVSGSTSRTSHTSGANTQSAGRPAQMIAQSPGT